MFPTIVITYHKIPIRKRLLPIGGCGKDFHQLTGSIQPSGSVVDRIKNARLLSVTCVGKTTERYETSSLKVDDSSVHLELGQKFIKTVLEVFSLG